MQDNKEIKAQLEDLFSDLAGLSISQKDALAPLKRPVEHRQIKRQQAVFQTLVENAPDAISINDMEGYQTYGNRACYNSFGYDYERQEMNGLPLTSLWPQDDIPALTKQLLPQAMAGGWRGEVRQKRKNGATFDAYLTIFPVLDSSGEPISIATITRDISKRKTLEHERDAMCEHRVLQIQLVAGLAQEIAAAPTLDGLYQRVVTLVKERLGYYHVQIFHHIPELSAVVLVKSYAHTGEEMGSAGHRLPYGKGIVGTAAITGKPILAPDVSQNSYWMHHPNFPNTQGELAVPMKLRNRVLGVLDVLSDTAGTLTREDEIVLLDLASRVASIIGSNHLLEEADVLRQFAQASEGIGWLALEDNTITYANSALCNILGAAQPEDLIGKSIISCYPEYLQERVQNEILPTAMREGQWTGELALLSTESIITPIVQSIFLAHDEIGSPLHLVTVVTDITAQKRAEILLDKQSQQIDCMNDISRKIEERPPLFEFLQWLTNRIPSVMQYPDACVVAIEFEGRIYGVGSAIKSARQIAEEIHIGSGEVAGRVHVSYTQECDFIDEEKALLGNVARRVSDYVENRRLSKQAQTTLEEVKVSHKLYLPAQWVERAPAQKPPEAPTPLITTPPNRSGLKAHLQSSRIYTALRAMWRRMTT
ncbi:MAG: hypothetical protein DRJ03_15630 [Chloroflexi bacterium]|nr:MAG: hypothetical protein B6I35_10255 [Anaerolineaceae bacterium 4572_32.2]RLC76053.1 MAG: hypothetical protein DRI81_10805 [Chloroflexota bacterium]RLC83934.1 MAG: hypothetical protein DRJ03_15630 [Chloroflexota bacterium]